MTRTVVIGTRGPQTERVVQALSGTAEIDIVACLDLGRPVATRLAQLAPDLTLIQEPASTPVPIALIREARHAAPTATLIVRAVDATPDWVADAINGGATAVLPSTVDATAIGRVALHIATEHDPAFEALRLRWAA
jgi:DNA-binding NarL/FixJ family response regulator